MKLVARDNTARSSAGREANPDHDPGGSPADVITAATPPISFLNPPIHFWTQLTSGKHCKAKRTGVLPKHCGEKAHQFSLRACEHKDIDMK